MAYKTHKLVNTAKIKRPSPTLWKERSQPHGWDNAYEDAGQLLVITERTTALTEAGDLRSRSPQRQLLSTYPVPSPLFWQPPKLPENLESNCFPLAYSQDTLLRM